MEKDTRSASSDAVSGSALVYDQIESFARRSMQRLLQEVLEKEVETLLGRTRSERREPTSTTGYRNGHGKERSLSTSIGTITVRRPRVRSTEEPFVSRLLPCFGAVRMRSGNCFRDCICMDFRAATLNWRCVDSLAMALRYLPVRSGGCGMAGRQSSISGYSVL